MLEKTFTQEQLNAVVRNEEGQVVINPEIVAEQVRIGWKKDQFAKHYDMPMTQVTNMLKALGLKIRKFHKPAFVIGGSIATTDVPQQNTETQETVEEVAEVNQENNNSEFVQEQTEQDLETPGEEQVAEETETQVEETQEVADQSTPTRASWNNG